MYTQTAYCHSTDCAAHEVTVTIPVASTDPAMRPVSTYCPFCGTASLVDEATHNRDLFLATLSRDGITITPSYYAKLHKRFCSQSVFVSLRDFINAVLFELPDPAPTRTDMGDTGTPMPHSDPRVTHADRMARVRAEAAQTTTPTPSTPIPAEPMYKTCKQCGCELPKHSIKTAQYFIPYCRTCTEQVQARRDMARALATNPAYRLTHTDGVL